MDETGQPGAATPGENGNGAAHGGELAGPANGWTPSDPGWSDPEPTESGETADVGPRRWRQPVERPSWAEPSVRFHPAPAVTGPALNGERPRNGSANDRFERQSSLAQLRSPASGPPAYEQDRPDSGPDRLAMPAPRPGQELTRPFGEPPAPSTGRTDAVEAARHVFDEPIGRPGAGQDDPAPAEPAVSWYGRRAPERVGATDPDDATPTGFEPPPGFRPGGYDPGASRLSVPAPRPPAPGEQDAPAWPRRRPAEPTGVPAAGVEETPGDQETRGVEPQAREARGLQESRDSWSVPDGPTDQPATAADSPSPAGEPAGDRATGWEPSWSSADDEPEPAQPQPNRWASAWAEREAVGAGDSEPVVAPDLPGRPAAGPGSPEDRRGLGGRGYPTRDDASARGSYESPAGEFGRRSAAPADYPPLSDLPQFGATDDWSELPSGPVNPAGPAAAATKPPVPAPALPAYPPALPAYPPVGERRAEPYGTARSEQIAGEYAADPTGYPSPQQPPVDRTAPNEGRSRFAWSEPPAAPQDRPGGAGPTGSPGFSGPAGSPAAPGQAGFAAPEPVRGYDPGREASPFNEADSARGSGPVRGSDPGVAARLAAQLRPGYPHRPVESAVQDDPAPGRRSDPLLDVLPQRIPAEPDVPIVPESPAVEPPAETPELARIATHLRREDAPSNSQDRPDGFDVQAILAAVRGVAGVRDASLRTTPAGAHSLRLDLSDGADPAEVSRQVARLLQDRMGLAAAPHELSGLGEVGPSFEDRPAEPAAEQSDAEEVPVPRRRRQAAAHRGRATVGDRGSAPVPAGATTSGSPAGGAPLAGTSYSGGQQLTTTESAPSRPLNPDGRPGPRVIIDHVQVSTFGMEATVEVSLSAADRRATGLTTGPAVDGYVLRLCAASAAAAIDELLRSVDPAPERGRCFVEHAAVLPFGSCEVATVVVLLVCDGWVEQLAGSALVSGDPRQAIVRATLAAVNRRLDALLA